MILMWAFSIYAVGTTTLVNRSPPSYPTEQICQMSAQSHTVPGKTYAVCNVQLVGRTGL
jgi:hypothetical protein